MVNKSLSNFPTMEKSGMVLKAFPLSDQKYLGYFSLDNVAGWVPEVNFCPFFQKYPEFSPRFFPKVPPPWLGNWVRLGGGGLA